MTHVLGNSELGKRVLEQALDITKETGDRNAEATVTYEQTLEILQEIGQGKRYSSTQ